MRKQPNGKWVEVSDQGMSREEHLDLSDANDGRRHGEVARRVELSNAFKLSDKEYDESELEPKDHYESEKGIREADHNTNLNRARRTGGINRRIKK